MIIIKNQEQIQKMRAACLVVKKTFETLGNMVKPGITTKELDDAVANFIKSQGAAASFKNYRGFPKSCCVSVNEEVIHGIPSSRRLHEGDVVSIDVGAYLDGFHGDAARTFAVGKVSAKAQKLIDVTRQSFFEGMKFARAEHFLHEISAAIQDYVEGSGFSVVRDFTGHGVGKDLHEAPEIPNFRQKNKGPRLRAGMTLAIEPMVNMGSHGVAILKDGWTVVTKDGSLSAHYEDTVLITDAGPEILTL